MYNTHTLINLEVIMRTELKTMKHTFKQKHLFDPANKDDIAEYRYYLQKGRWKNYVCPFEIEWPHLGIPQMIASKIAEYYVTKVVK